MDNLSGQVVRGYELRELSGAGGFGAVYRAFQPAIGREVAIKVILPQYANQPEFIRRFDAEAQLVARLEHPYIVPLYDYWREPDGAYLVMRWLGGGSLRETFQGNAVDEETVLRILDQIAGALAVAHRNQVVHRDLKPDNILLDQDGNAYLTDFGIAKDIGSKDSGEREEEGLTGSPAYMSPEQITSEQTTPQTDVYALGVILYELLTGLHPFRDSTVSQLIFNHLQDPLPYAQGLSEEINDIIQIATAKNPNDRYQDVLELPAAFRRAISYQNQNLITLVPEVDLSTVVNPYKGLRSFEEADAINFFGRENLTAQLVARLGESHNLARFLAVVGPSGSGKSSAVKAGLLPALKQNDLPGAEDWFFVEMVPGDHPLTALSEALLSVAMRPSANLLDQLSSDTRSLLSIADSILKGVEGDLLLIIDQFEEVFTLIEDEAERVHFLDLLRVAVTEQPTRLRVVITLRADFYDRPLLYDGFGELIQARTHVVLPLSADEIQRAVVGPAERVGLQVDANLLATIVADVQEEPGALPLLQYALTEVFERREGLVLTLETYQSIGGVSGALVRRAEELYTQMNPSQQALLRQVLLRLVTLGEGSEDTRRRIGWAELTSISSDTTALQQVLDTFGKYRLFSFDRDSQTRTPTVELAHESLLRQWGRLRDLLDASRADVRQERLLAAAVNEWRDANYDSSFLLSGTRLAQIEEWAAATNLALTQEERDFVQASVSERQRQEAAESERRAHEAELELRARNRLQILAVVMAVAFVVAIGLTAIAFNQSKVARNNAVTATLAQGQALVEAGNAQTQAAIADNERAGAENARATSDANSNLAGTNEAIANTQAAIADNERAGAENARATSDVNANLAGTNEAIANTQVAIADRNSEEAESLAQASGAMQALSASNTDLAVALALQANHIPEPPFQAQQALIAAGFAPGTRRLFTGHTDRVLDAAFTPDGRSIISVSTDGSAILWNVESGEAVQRAELVTPTSVNSLGASLALSPDGQRALFTFTDGTLILWDITNWQEIRHETLSIGLWRAVFAPDGYHALLGFQLNSDNLYLVDVNEWQIVTQLSGHNEGVPAVAFSPDGKTAISGSIDHDLILWNLRTGEEIRRFTGHTGSMSDVVFNADGTQIFSGAADGEAILWDVQSGQLINRFQYKGGGIESVAFNPDGRSAAAGLFGGGLVQWDLQTGVEVQHYNGHTTDILSVTFSSDGTMLLSASADTTIRLWDVNGGAELRRFHLNEIARSVAISPDGTLMLSGTGQGSLALWNLETGEVIRELDKQADSVLRVRFTDDGQYVLTASYDGSVVIWNVATGQALHTFHQDGYVASDFTLRPDNHSIVISMFSTVNFTTDLISLDIDTGEELGRVSYDGTISGVALSPDGREIVASILTGSGYPAGAVELLDAETGDVIQHFDYPSTAPVYAIAISPDGLTALSASGDNNVILWDLESGTEIRRFIGHSDEVHSVAFSPDGKTALSGSQDSTLILWDVSTGQQLVRYRGHTDRARGFFGPDGQMIVSASADGSIRFWRVPPRIDEMIAWTRVNRYIAPLTCDQRRLYRVDPLCGEEGDD